MVVNVSIELQPNHQGELVYQPGQKLNGVVHLNLNEDGKTFRGIYVVVYGAAKVHWAKTITQTVNGQRQQYEGESFDGREIVLDSKIYLFGHQGAKAVEITPGAHKYPFYFDLPELLPESILTPRGKIEYNIEAFLDTPWLFDKKIKVDFTIKRHEDLNKFEILKHPLEEEEEDVSCCCCCASEPCKVKITIPHGGFAAGQDIPVKIEYNNKTGSEVTETKFKLVRSLQYKCSSPTTKTINDTEVVIEHKAEGAGGNESKIITAFIPIPGSSISTNERYCQNIQISYILKAKTKFAGCVVEMEFKFPIVIGSVGIRNVSNVNSIGFSVGPNISPYPPAPNIASIPPYPPAPSDLAPPSFDEATQGVGWSYHPGIGYTKHRVYDSIIS